MDWAKAIECHRQPLLRIVTTLYAMIGLAQGGSIDRLGRPIYRKVLNLLRPAEWAVRRLIVIAAQGLVVAPRAAGESTRQAAVAGKTKGKRQRRRAFALLDPLARYSLGFRRRHVHPAVGPRIRSFDTPTGVVVYLNGAPPAPPQPAPEPDDSVNGKSLCRRLEAIKRALADIPGQAKRYARLRAKAIAQRHPKRETKLRRLPPSNPRRKPRHEVHEILEECDWLFRTLPALNSS